MHVQPITQHRFGYPVRSDTIYILKKDFCYILGLFLKNDSVNIKLVRSKCIITFFQIKQSERIELCSYILNVGLEKYSTVC